MPPRCTSGSKVPRNTSRSKPASVHLISVISVSPWWILGCGRSPRYASSVSSDIAVMARRSCLLVLGLLLGGCTRAQPDSPKPSVPIERPPPAEPPRSSDELPGVPEPPWSVSYHDGSGNGFLFAQSSPGEPARFTYSPITPERSSTGSYSGGEPAAGVLDGEQAMALWQRVRRLEADTEIHTEQRMKRTGSFRLVSSNRERAFIVNFGDELASFDAFVAPFRSGPGGSPPP
jgi:hypothetical protein